MPLIHEPAPGWSTTVAPSPDQFAKFEELTRKLTQVSKSELDEKRQQA